MVDCWVLRRAHSPALGQVWEDSVRWSRQKLLRSCQWMASSADGFGGRTYPLQDSHRKGRKSSCLSTLVYTPLYFCSGSEHTDRRASGNAIRSLRHLLYSPFWCRLLRLGAPVCVRRPCRLYRGAGCQIAYQITRRQSRDTRRQRSFQRHVQSYLIRAIHVLILTCDSG